MLPDRQLIGYDQLINKKKTRFNNVQLKKTFHNVELFQSDRFDSGLCQSKHVFLEPCQMKTIDTT